jgi:hypothetical protein
MPYVTLKNNIEGYSVFLFFAHHDPIEFPIHCIISPIHCIISFFFVGCFQKFQLFTVSYHRSLSVAFKNFNYIKIYWNVKGETSLSPAVEVIGENIMTRHPLLL